MKFTKHILLFFILFTCSIGFANQNNRIEMKITLKDSINKVFQDNVHLVAEISNPNPSINDSIVLTFIMYVSPLVSIEKWDKVSQPSYKNFNAENVEIGNLKIESGNYKGKAYRYVILQKIKLKAKKRGAFNIDPLILSITGKIPSLRKDTSEGLTNNILTSTFKTNSVSIHVN